MKQTSERRSFASIRLGSSYRLDWNPLAIFTGCTAAASHVAAAPQGSSVQAILELPAGLGLPGFNRHPVLLLNPVPVPFWDHVEAAEWNYPQIWGEIVYVTALQPLLVLVVLS